MILVFFPPYTSLIAIFGAISVFGMHNTVIKYAEETIRRGTTSFFSLLKISFGINIFLGLIFGTFCILFRNTISYYLVVPVNLIFIASATIAPFAVCRTMTFIFRALRAPKKSLVVDVTGPFFFILALLILQFFNNASLTMIIWGNLLTIAVPVIIGLYFLNQFTSNLLTTSDNLDKKKLWNILSFSFFAFIATISSLSGSEIDRLLIALILDPQAVGQYNAAARTAFQLNIFYISFSYAFAPQIVKEYLDQATSSVKDCKRASLLFLLVAPVYIAAIGLGKYIMLLFGSKYLPALGVFLIIAFGGYINLLLGPSEVYLRMRGFQKFEAVTFITSMITTITIDLFLIPKVGIIGAAVGSATGFITFKIITTIYAVKFGFIQKPERLYRRILYIIPPLLGGLVFNQPLSLIALVIVGLFLLFTFEKDAIKELAVRVKAVLIPIISSD